MPTGPNGQKRPADTNAAAVMVARIAVGEIDEAPISEPRGRAGGVARAAALSAEERVEIASAGAGARWDAKERRERSMNTATKHGVPAAVTTGVRMYPNNSLREPVREFEKRVFAMVKATFAK